MPTTTEATMVAAPPCQPLLRACTVPSGEPAITGGHRRSLSSVEDSYSGLRAANGQPYNYPAPVYVRNTFVVLVPGRDPSLDEFYEERRIHSCPPSWGPTFEKEDEQGSFPEPPASSSTTVCSVSECGDTCTPPPEFSDADDLADLSPRAAANGGASARAAAMPTSNLRVALSEYSSRTPLTPGPIQRNPARRDPHAQECRAPSGYNTGYANGYEDIAGTAAQGQNAAQGAYGDTQSYVAGYDTGYAGAYNAVYDTRYMNSYDGMYNTNLDGESTCCPDMGVASYQPSAYGDQQGYHCGYQANEFAASASAGSMDFPMPPEPLPQVLQLSAAIQSGMQPPPPAGAPAPTTSSVQYMPPPPPTGADMHYQDAAFVAPTRGSMNHGNGRCKPCAFVFTKGCGNGFECPFCHLCDQGEKKKRRKDKLEANRAMREMRQVFNLSFSGSLGFSRRGSASSS